MWGCVVKAPSAWLTYIGSLPLTSHHSSSLTNTGLHTHKDAHTHTPFIHHSGGSVHWCFAFSPFLSPFLPPFPPPPPLSLHLPGHLCVVRYEQYQQKKKKKKLCCVDWKKQNKTKTQISFFIPITVFFFFSLSSFHISKTSVRKMMLTWFCGSGGWLWASGAWPWPWLSLPPTGEPRVVAVMLATGQILAILAS